MGIDKRDANDPGSRSLDVVAENLARLKAMFPEVLTEGPQGVAVNIDVLKALVGDRTVTDADEKYGLDWHGKRQARRLALTHSTGTLRPCPQESLDWETTGNLVIEGDNLEVLKLLQKGYAGKVRLIYIDPPYNTGQDFVYRDDYRDKLKNYVELTGQAERGRRIPGKAETGGRLHTDWLNMMYPRLKLARNLLAEDGVMFISIDDTELARLQDICDEIFGEGTFLGSLAWRKKSSISYLSASMLTIHEHILVYSKGSSGLALVDEMRWQHDTEPVFHVFQAGNPERERVIRAGARLRKAEGSSRRVVMAAGTYRLPSHRVELLSEAIFQDGALQNDIRVRGRFTVGQALLDQKPGAVVVSTSGMMYREKDEGARKKPPLSIIDEKQWVTRTAGAELKALFDREAVFSYPKPVGLIRYLCHLLPDPGALVLDFFAGSGTTGHAVMAQNAADGGHRRYILVQLPEPLDPADRNQKAAADLCDQVGRPRTLAEVTKERLRRASRRIGDENPFLSGDLGFRVFKLDTSNLRVWDPAATDFEAALVESAGHLKPDRTPEDLLYELLLKSGLDLCAPIQTRFLAGRPVHAVGGGVLLACLAPELRPDEVEALALGLVEWHGELAPEGETTCVFRDGACADGVARADLVAILQQHGIAHVRTV